MKSKRKDIKKSMSPDKFPHLGLYSDGTIVLFYREGSGVVVNEGINAYGNDCLGGHLPELNNNYEMYEGEITLKNEGV